MAMAVLVCLAPGIFTHWLGESDLMHERASKYVDKASPMPATRNLTGALAITAVSTRTRSGFLSKKKYSSNSLFSVYMTVNALVGASVEAIVGTTITGLISRSATPLAVSR